MWDGNRILQEIESNGFEVVLPSSATTEGVVKAIQVPASRTRLYVYEPDSHVWRSRNPRRLRRGRYQEADFSILQSKPTN